MADVVGDAGRSVAAVDTGASWPGRAPQSPRCVELGSERDYSYSCEGIHRGEGTSQSSGRTHSV